MGADITVDELLSFTRYLSWADLQEAIFQKEMDSEVDEDDPDAIREHEWRWFGMMSYFYASVFVVVEAWGELKFSDPVLDRLLTMPNMKDMLRRYRNAVLHFQGSVTSSKFLEFLKVGEGHAFWTIALHREFVRFWFDYLASQMVTPEQRAVYRRMIEDGTLSWYPFQYDRVVDQAERSLKRVRDELANHPDDESESRRDLERVLKESEEQIRNAPAAPHFEKLRAELLRKVGIENYPTRPVFDDKWP